MEVNLKKTSINEVKYSDVCKYILSKEYGENVEYSILAKMFNLNLKEESDWKKLSNRMKQVKNILIDYGIVLKNVVGIGYYILKPKQISSYCYRTYVDKSKSLLEKSERILKGVNQSELSEVRKKEHKEMTLLNKELSVGMDNFIENSDYDKNKTYYNSLED